MAAKSNTKPFEPARRAIPVGHGTPCPTDAFRIFDSWQKKKANRSQVRLAFFFHSCLLLPRIQVNCPVRVCSANLQNSPTSPRQ